jgi:hypothetical protein
LILGVKKGVRYLFSHLFSLFDLKKKNKIKKFLKKAHREKKVSGTFFLNLCRKRCQVPFLFHKKIGPVIEYRTGPVLINRLLESMPPEYIPESMGSHLLDYRYRLAGTKHRGHIRR